jgi:hypothetical protein
MVGYSLGGLITRYAIGRLDQDGFFNDNVKPGVRRCSWFTLAEWHLLTIFIRL